MHPIRNFPSVTAICVTVTLVFYTVFTSRVNPMLASIPGLGFVVGVFASVGLYLSLFQLLLWIYYARIEDIVNPREAITGEWFYRLEILGKENEPRYGICRISRHKGELYATGIHFHPAQHKFTSRFSSEFICLDGHAMVIMYNSAGVDEEMFMRQGVYFLSTEGIPPNRIYGIWTDLLPSQNTGDIVLQRRDTNTDSILERIGYPSKSSELQKILNAPTIPPKSDSRTVRNRRDR